MATNRQHRQNWPSYLHSSPSHSETDWNIVIWTGMLTAAIIRLPCVQSAR